MPPRDVVENHFCAPEEFEAGSGQRDSSGGAGQQRRAHIALQPLDQLAECRLSDPQSLGGAPEVQFGGYRHERLQLAQLHWSTVRATGRHCDAY